MPETGENTLRPFHETIVDAIRKARGEELVCLAKLIITTRIPKGHDEIIAAWKERTARMNAAEWDEYNVNNLHELCNAPTSIFTQKVVAQTAAENVPKFSFEGLEQEAKKLLTLLAENEARGHAVWHMFMQERLENLYALTSQALGK